MEFTDYLVSYSCYPRCQHAHKYLKQLSYRYDDLQETDKTCRNNDSSEFHLFLQTSEKEHLLEIKDVLKRDEKFHYHEPVKCENIKDFIRSKGYPKEKYLVVIINEKISKDTIPQSDKVKIIIVLEDGRDRDRAIELYKGTQNIHISLKEDISDQVSNIMERCIFKTFYMKEKCEQLFKTFNGIVRKGDARQEKSTFLSIEESNQRSENKYSPRQRPKSDEYTNQRDNALKRPSTTKRSISFQDRCLKDITARSTKHDLHGPSTLTAEMSSKLEAVEKKRSKGTNMSFEGENDLYDVWKPRIESTEILQKPKHAEKTERLYDEIMGMFSRSRVPKDERPQLDKPFDGTVNNTLKQDLKRLSPDIRSCGYRCRSFVVFVDDECNPELLKPDLEIIMKKHNISTFTIVPSNVKQFVSCNVGSQVTAEFDKDTIKHGTLGGFGLASSDKERKPIGLVSRHVVTVGNIPASILRVGSEDQPIEASVLVDRSFGDRENVLDIAAASFAHNKESLNTKYKTSEQRAAKGRLSNYSLEEMKGLPVHICGSTTPLGYGTVTMPKIEAIRDKDMDENFIVIEDRENPGTVKKTFCREGDSGAIVCADDQENPEEVKLISMVIGGNTKKPGSYYSLNLKNGIQQVEEETKSTIDLL